MLLIQLLFANYIVYSLRLYDTIDCLDTQKVIKLYYLLKILAIVSFISNMGWSKLCADFPKARTTWSMVEKVQVISSLQTSFYKTVVKVLYFWSEQQMCENYPFSMVIWVQFANLFKIK